MKTKKIYKKICATSLLLCLFILCLIWKNNIIEASNNTFNLTTSVDTEANNNRGAINIDWSTYNDNTSTFKGYQSTDGGKTWQTISLVDFNSIKELKVLNVYPDAGNNLKTWMETNGYGMGIIKVDEVSISNFNVSPQTYLKKTNNEWNYDVVVFGFWDRNGNRDLSLLSRNVIESFILDGKGVIFGHDTILNNSIQSTDTYEISGGPVKNGQGNFDYLGAKFFPMTYVSTGYTASSAVTVVKKGIFTSFPHDLGEIGTTYTVPPTHTWGQYLTDTSNVWMAFSEPVTPTNFYLVTNNNVAMIQTGHMSGQATEDEQKLLANTIFYTYQISSATETTDYSGMDTAAPERPSISVSNNSDKILVTMNSKDKASSYQYYIEAYDSVTGELEATSKTASAEIMSDIKGYYYIVDDSANNNFNINNATYTESNTISLNYDNKKYLHVKSVDKAGNVSEVSTISLTRTISFDAAGGTLSSNTISVYLNKNTNNSISSLIPRKTGHTFGGWYNSSGIKIYDENGNCTNDGTVWKNGLYVYDGDITLTAKWIINNYTLDLNGYLDETLKNNTYGYLTFDVYINGELSSNDATDYCSELPYGTIFEITDIKPCAGHSYDGVHAGILSGTLSDTKRIALKSNTLSYTVTCKDVVGDKLGKVLGTSSWTALFGTEVTGETQGTSDGLGDYYTGYYYTESTKEIVSENGATVYRIFTPKEYRLDVNGHLDNALINNTGGYLTFDVYVDGILVADDVDDYCSSHPHDSQYEIKDIKGTLGHSYVGVHSGELSGTITSEIAVCLSGKTNSYNVTYKDVVGSESGKVLNSSTATFLFGTTVSGEDKGTSTVVGEYYEGYYYSSSTTSTVSENGTTVYRIFVPEKYEVTFKDVVKDTNEVLGEKKELIAYDTTVSADSLGSSTDVGIYYTDYQYSGCSTPETVTTNGAVVYRYFIYKPLELGNNVEVKDLVVEYNEEFHGVKLESSIPNLTIMYGTKPSVYNLTSCPTFKNTGEHVVYYQISKEGYTPVEGSAIIKISKTGGSLADVYATQSSTFTVTIPKIVVLDGKEGSGAYTIKVEGNISGTDIITVTPDNNFLMKQEGKSDIETTITQTNTEFSYALGVKETGFQTETGSIKMASISAGKWSGLFNFTITSSVDLEAEDSIASTEQDIVNITPTGNDTAQGKQSEFNQLKNVVE